jgi:hypothetical protein
MEVAFFVSVFALLVVFLALRSKPTVINNGDHYHYYGREGREGLDGGEKPKSLIDENVRQLARDAGELHREFRGIEKGEKISNDRTLPE